jgi:hypothetical protein
MGQLTLTLSLFNNQDKGTLLAGGRTPDSVCMEEIHPRTGLRLLLLTALLPCLLALSIWGVRGSAREAPAFGLSLWLLMATAYLAVGWLGLLMQWISVTSARRHGRHESTDHTAVMQISVTLGAILGGALWPLFAYRIASWAEPGRPPLQEMQVWLGLPGAVAGVFLTWRLLELVRILRGRGMRPFGLAQATSIAVLFLFLGLMSAFSANSYEEVQETRLLIRNLFEPQPKIGNYDDIRTFQWGVHRLRGGLQKAYTIEFSTGMRYRFWSDETYSLLQRRTGRSAACTFPETEACIQPPRY